MEQDKMREEFEAAYMASFVGEDSSQLRAAWLERGSDGEYRSYQARGAWWAWQASREAVVVELPYAGTLLAPQWNEAIYRCRAAIHAAGIRTR